MSSVPKGTGEWVHQFAPTAQPYQVGESSAEDEIMHHLMARPMACIHCGLKYIQGVEPYPGGFCPARNDKRELKRIKRRIQ